MGKPCCEREVRSVPGWPRVEGARWTCPTCHTQYVWDEDEAEGGAWWPVNG